MENNKVYNLFVDYSRVRLDKYIGEKCPELSRSQAHKLISEGYVKVNDRLTKAGIKLDIGDRLTITIPLRIIRTADRTIPQI